MREVIHDHVKDALTLEQVRDGLLYAITLVKKSAQTKVGYVAGIITSDGPTHVKANIQRLGILTEQIREREKGLIFSAVDVFDDVLFTQLNAHTLPQESWWMFWRDVLGSGLVTDIYMTPRWQESTGAKDEHSTATRVGLNIHYEE